MRNWNCAGLLFGIGLSALSLIFSVKALAGAPLAVLMSCKGDISIVKSAGETVPGTFGLPLQAGDIVKTGEDSQAEILFEDGNWIQMGAGSSMQVKGSKNMPAEKTEQKSFEVVQNFLKLKDSGGTSSLAGLRSGDTSKEIELESPCQTKIRVSDAGFRWIVSDSSMDLRLTIYNENGIHWTADIDGGASFLAYPSDAPPLVPGIAYSWTLETTDPLLFPPLRTQAAFFEILSPEEAEALEHSLSKLSQDRKPSEGTYHLMRASLFFDRGLIEEAISETKWAIESESGNSALHAILARLYAEAGRNEDAVEEYNRLLEKH